MTEEKCKKLEKVLYDKVSELYDIPAEMLGSRSEHWSSSCSVTIFMEPLPEKCGLCIRYWYWDDPRFLPKWSQSFNLFGVKGDHRTVISYHYSGYGKIKITEEMKAGVRGNIRWRRKDTAE